jgi:glycosyltransferase involved in cell wall biosynthesis
MIKGASVTVTVIIPAKDEEKRIGKVIEGIKAVSGDYEIIIVDDGSSDSTYSVAKSLK